MHGFNVVGVQFHRAGRIYDFLAGDVDCKVGDQVLVDSERGPSLALVKSIKFFGPKEYSARQLKPILRKATSKEVQKNHRYEPQEITDFAKHKIMELGLDMRVLQGDVQFGGSKIVIYFIAPGRVDFRELVKELAGGLKARVELKQVGARDETKILGGIGICGREYCCSSFLREFVPVSIRMAKNQNLALNPGKVSGGCGRLLCCLTYEDKTYSLLRQTLPPRGARVRILSTEEEGLVLKSDLLNQEVLVETKEGPVGCKAHEVEVLDRPSTGEDWNQSEDKEEWGEDLDLEALETQLGINEPQDKKKKKFYPKKFQKKVDNSQKSR
jgi:cell fate regulator YaaT (PSP1 superfamily)